MSTNLADKKEKKQKQLSDMIGFVLNSMQNTGHKDENQEFLNTIFKAKQELLDAQNYFDSVTAPELVDHAIYKMEAAKSHYTYLIKQAKDRGLRVNI